MLIASYMYFSLQKYAEVTIILQIFSIILSNNILGRHLFLKNLPFFLYE